MSSGRYVLEKEKLHPDFVKVVNNVIEKLNLCSEDFIETNGVDNNIASYFRVDCCLRNKTSKRAISFDSCELRLAQAVVALWLQDLSEDEFVFNIVAFIFDGLLRSINEARNVEAYKCYFNENYCSWKDILENLEYLNSLIPREQIYYHNATKRFTVCDIDWFRQVTYLYSKGDIERLLINNICLYIYGNMLFVLQGLIPTSPIIIYA